MWHDAPFRTGIPTHVHLGTALSLGTVGTARHGTARARHGTARHGTTWHGVSGVCLPPSLSSKRIWNGVHDGPRNAMPALARSPYVGPRLCHFCHVELSPNPQRGSPSHARNLCNFGFWFILGVCFLSGGFLAGGLLNPRIATGLVAMRPTGGYKNLGDRQTDAFRTNPDNMKPAERLGIRTRSWEFVEACIQRLILDTLYKYGHLSVLSNHAVELNREEFEQARSADDFLRTNSASIDTTAPQGMCPYVHHQSWLLFLFVRCPRRPPARSAPRGRMDSNQLRDIQVEFRPGFRICFTIGALTWAGVFVTFAFSLRGPPQPRSPIGLNTMPDCAPILRNLKRKCIIFLSTSAHSPNLLDRDETKQTLSTARASSWRVYGYIPVLTYLGISDICRSVPSCFVFDIYLWVGHVREHVPSPPALKVAELELVLC